MLENDNHGVTSKGHRSQLKAFPVAKAEIIWVREESSKPDRERQISYDIAYMWNLKIWYKWTYLQKRNRLTDIGKKLMVTKGGRGGDISKLGEGD